MILKNERMLVEIAELGAELMRIYDIREDREMLWNGDAAFWKRRAPILFPNVGRTWNNVMRVGGREFATSQHGFARDRVFECVESDETRAIYLLKSDEETLARYPFAFELYVEYALEGGELKVTWRVKNTGNETMYFTIGGHPAFRFADAEGRKDSNCLWFPGKSELENIYVDLTNGTAIPEEVFPVKLENERLPLSEELLSKDALIFDGGQFDEVWICAADGAPYLGMKCAGFPSFGVWSVPGAPFVCLEPWMGRCDNRGFEGDLSEKQFVNAVEADGCFKAEYSICLR